MDKRLSGKERKELENLRREKREAEIRKGTFDSSYFSDDEPEEEWGKF